jgi:hypothetical protein
MDDLQFKFRADRRIVSPGAASPPAPSFRIGKPLLLPVVASPRGFDWTSCTPWSLIGPGEPPHERQPMITTCWPCCWEYQIMWNWIMLGLESNRVIRLRVAKLMRGGKAAQREAQRMVSEKMLAAAKAGTSLMAGASGDKIVEQYRRKVTVNAKRLSRKRTRRRRRSI